MRTCVVKGCKSKSSKGSSLRFHAFPSDEARRQLWWSNIQSKRTLKDSTTICELHFDPDDYDEMKRLKQDAVPWASEQDCAESCDSLSAVEEVCRICLASDCKVFDLRDCGLQQSYSDVSGITVTSADCLPQVLCWECSARVRAAARLRSRARAAQRALLALLETHGAITREAVSSVNTRAENLASQLSRKHIKPIDYYACMSEDTEKNDLKPLNELDVKNETPEPEFEEFVDEIHDIDEDDDDKKDFIEVNETNDEVGNENAKNKELHNKNEEGDVNDVFELNDRVSDDVTSTKLLQDIANDTGIRRRVQNPKENTKDKDKHTVFIKDFTITKVNIAEEIEAVERRKETAAYKNASYKCEVCYRGYREDARYNAHILKHTDKYGTFECSVCRVRYATKRMLQNHAVSFHSRKYKCNKCPFVTSHLTTARYHVKFHEGTIFKCPHCPLQFQIATTYYGHLRLKHACAEVCEYCGHTFLNKYGATRHKNIVHKFDKDTVPLVGPHCDACDVKFASQQAYDKHLTMSSKHRKEDESLEPIRNAYIRPATNRQNKNDQKRAKKYQKRAKNPVECEQCGLTLGSRILYAWHFKKKHPGLTRAAARPADLLCEQCGRTFASMAYLIDHKWVHTGEKNFKCDLCGKTFTKKTNLVVHMNVHNASRPSFECPVCGKLFGYYNNRQRHMFIHTGQKPYKCESCQKSFATTGEQRSHVEHVHQNKPWPRRIRSRGRQTQKDPTED